MFPVRSIFPAIRSRVVSSLRPGTSAILQPAPGFTLIEVMVSLVLLAGGLLSAAYMQTYSLQFGQESYHRGQTLVSVNKLMDGMRSMQVASNNVGGGQTNYTNSLSGAEANAGCDATSSTPRNDMVCFMEELSETLPFGTATVAVNASDNSYYDITVYWSDRGLSEQAGFSDSDLDDASVNLNNAAECNAANNRIWSGALDENSDWPFGNGPGEELCLVSHTYSVQILDTSTL